MLRPHSAHPLRSINGNQTTQINRLEPTKHKQKRQLKHRPQKKVWDTETLQFTIINLKKHVHEIQDENIRFRTKITVLEKQNERLKNYLLTGQASGNFSLAKSTLFSGNQREASLIINLKNELRQAKANINSLQEQNEILRKCVKYTNISEIQIEKKALLDESTRLRTIVGQLIHNQNMQLAYKKQAQSLGQQLAKKVEENQKLSVALLNAEQKLRQVQSQRTQIIASYQELQTKVTKDMKIARLKIQDNIRRQEVYKKYIDNLKRQGQKMAQTMSQKNKKKTDRMAKTFDVVVPPIKLRAEDPVHPVKIVKEEKFSIQGVARDEVMKLGISVIQQILGEQQLVKQEIQQIPPEENDSYEPDYEDSPSEPSEITPQLRDISDLLRYRLQAQRYDLQELCQDIDSSCPKTLSKPQILDVFEKQPFFLTVHQAAIITCFIFDGYEIISKTNFIDKIQELIKSINIFDEQLENQIAESILKKLQKSWEHIKNISDGYASKQLLVEHLLILNFQIDEIELILNDLSLNSPSLDELNIMNLREIYVQEVPNTIEEEDQESLHSKHSSLISRRQYNISDMEEYSNSYI